MVLDLLTKSSMSLASCESLGLRNVPSLLQKSLGGELLPAAIETGRYTVSHASILIELSDRLHLTKKHNVAFPACRVVGDV